MGMVAQWFTAAFVAGQYFDRSESQAVARNMGVAQVEDVLNPASSFSLPVLNYMLQFVRVWLLEPVLVLFGGTHLLQIPRWFWSSMKERLAHPTVQRIAHYSQYVPPIQLILAAFVFSICIFYLQDEAPPRGLELFAIAMQPTSRDDGLYTSREAGDHNAEGAYEQLPPPSWRRILFLMSCGGTMLSILLYGRISFPIPDLVAGSNVLKALRNEAKGNTGVSSCVAFSRCYVRR